MLISQDSYIDAVRKSNGTDRAIALLLGISTLQAQELRKKYRKSYVEAMREKWKQLMK